MSTTRTPIKISPQNINKSNNNSSSTPIFCCRSCHPLTNLNNPTKIGLFRFGWHMMNPPSPNPSSIPSSIPTPTPTPTTPTTPTSQSSTLQHTLSHTPPYIVLVERFTHASRDSTRYFCPDPNPDPDPASAPAFLELAPALVQQRGRGAWVRGWEYVKMACDAHPGPWFNCFLLQRGPRVIATVELVEYENGYEYENEIEIENKNENEIETGDENGKREACARKETADGEKSRASAEESVKASLENEQKGQEGQEEEEKERKKRNTPSTPPSTPPPTAAAAANAKEGDSAAFSEETFPTVYA
ncbi:hypothetical protein LZ554_005286 [Drepanopeziza brunnea f. sp. 'monogermtubi']|nr:hypothetical protein LZ554_005286 [Drepanopeziza brunnea f. sp. 'monogermtubi']